MKKKILIVLLILAAVLGGLAVWQRNNLTALVLSGQSTPDELASQMEDGRKDLVDKAGTAADVSVRDLTPEEREALRNNTLTPEELVALLAGGAADPAVPEPTPTAAPSETPEPVPTPEPTETPEPTLSPEPTPSPEPTAGPEAEQQRLNELIAELVVMQETYTAWLADTHQAAIDEFNALPKAEQTHPKKIAIGLRYMDLGLAKEDECDARVAAIEDEIRGILTRQGKSTGLADEIHAFYLNEKALKKAYYLGLH